MTDRSKRLLPPWLLRLLGLTSIATLLVAIYFAVTRSRKSIGSRGDTSSSSQSSTSNGKKAAKMKRRRVTLSLKNTVLWNPSNDMESSVHAFKSDALTFLKALVRQHEVYIVAQVNNDEEREQLAALLEETPLEGFDPRKIVWCEKEEGKVHLVRHLESQIHIEGGWEQDDGEDVVRQLKPFVPKIIWVQKQSRHVPLGASVEMVQDVVDTSFAKDVLAQ